MRYCRKPSTSHLLEEHEGNCWHLFLQHRLERISVIIADISFILKFYFTSKGYSVKNLIPLRRVNSHMVKIILSSVLRKHPHFNSSPTIFCYRDFQVFFFLCFNQRIKFKSSDPFTKSVNFIKKNLGGLIKISN